MSPTLSPYTDALQYLHTLRDVLRFAVSRFNEARLSFGHGSDNAHAEEMAKVLALVENRVCERIPVAYLTQQAWQGDFDFYVDERVIVPRSFIYELLGEPFLSWIEYPELIHRALDLYTGSAALAIQMAHHYPDAQIDAVDISLDALEVAAINVQNYGLEEQIQLIHSDMFEGLEGGYDLIVSNPPYVDAASVADLPEEYLHEPELALGSGEDGLDATRIILENAAQMLNPKGVLLVEIGHNRDDLERAYPNLPFTWLETSGGDGFDFLLTREQLLENVSFE